MALGAVKGIWTFGANSILASNAATLLSGSSTVARGDLIVVVIGEVVANTSTGASDTLGNTYTAATAGTLGGGVSGRAFYSILTTGGTNTNINVAATASANNVAIVAACFEGSFSAVDKTPANNNNTDNASPFVCPSTTTLSQALEVVIGWMVDNTANAKAATSPNILVNQRNQTTISTVMGSQRVNVTTAVTPNFTGTNPTGSQQGTLSFRAASFPAGTGYDLGNRPFPYLYPIQLRTWIGKAQIETAIAATLPFTQTDWPITRPIDWPSTRMWAKFQPPINVLDVEYVERGPLYTNPREHPYHVQLRSFFGRLPPPLRLPTGQFITDLTQRPYPYPQQTRTWTWSYNLNLIGQDKLPTGEIVTERPTLRLNTAANWIEGVSLNLRNPPIPFNEFDWPLPGVAARPSNLSTWIDQTKLLLAVPFSQADWPAPARPAWGRTWVQPYNLALNTVVVVENPFAQYDWSIPRQLPRERTWVQPYNLALNTIVVVTNPFVQSDWPITPPAAPLPRTIAASYNPNLVGQDRLPNRQQDWPVPRAHSRQPDLTNWVDRVKLLLAVPFGQDDWPINRGPLQPNRSYGAAFPRVLIGQDKLPTGTDLTDLPPQPQASLQRNWVQTVNLALITQAAVKPFNQQDWPLTPAAKQAAQSFTGSYNRNLIGQDRLPNRQQDWPNPKPRARDAITWVDRHKSYLQRPHRQTDWPTPKGYRQSAQSWTNPLNLALTVIPGDPFSQTSWPLPQGAAPQLQTWANSLNLALNIAPSDLPFNQADWPNPRGHRQSALSYTVSYNLNLVGQDRLPNRQMHWPVPRDPRRLSDWIFSTNGNLLLPTPPPPFYQHYWPLPDRPPLLMQKTVFWEASLFQPPWVPPAPPPPGRTRQIVVGSEWQPYDRMRDWPGPVGWR